MSHQFSKDRWARMRFKILLALIFITNQFSEISGSTDQFTTIQVNRYGVNRNVLLQKIVCSPNSFFVKSISRKISWKWISRNGSLCPYYYSIGTTWCKWMVSLRVKLCSLAFFGWSNHWRKFSRKRMPENRIISGKYRSPCFSFSTRTFKYVLSN